jgi:hypothetical protein
MNISTSRRLRHYENVSNSTNRVAKACMFSLLLKIPIHTLQPANSSETEVERSQQLARRRDEGFRAVGRKTLARSAKAGCKQPRTSVRCK